MRILIIEDDRLFAEALKDSLETQFAVDVTYTGQEGCLMTYSGIYDLCIIDLYLPDMDGREVCKLIKGIFPELPIIFITGEVKTSYKVSSLDSGADDYITKPIKPPELMARIRAVMRRKNDNSNGTSYFYKGLDMDLKNRVCSSNGKMLHVSKKEFDILFLLLKNNNRTVRRERLISGAWQEGENIQSNVLDVYISKLRKKLPNSLKIESVYSSGYILK